MVEHGTRMVVMMITCNYVDCFGVHSSRELDDELASNWVEDLLWKGTWKAEVVDGMIALEYYMYDPVLDMEPHRARASFLGEYGPLMKAMVKRIKDPIFIEEQAYWVNRFRVTAEYIKLKRGIA